MVVIVGKVVTFAVKLVELVVKDSMKIKKYVHYFMSVLLVLD